MLDVISNISPRIIAEKMIIRYVNMCDKIRRGVWSDYTLTREYSQQLDLIVSFLILNFYRGYTQPMIEHNANLAILNRIVQSYNEFHHKILDKNPIKKVIRNFTAILLLKLTHKVHIAIKYHPLTSYAVASQVDQFMNKELTVKIMIETQNQLVMIPRNCANYFKLKDCTIEELNKTLNYLNKKYKLKREVQGWQIQDYLNGILKQIFQEANDFVWNNFYVYKQYFYQHLFILLAYLAEHFHIGSDHCMDLLDDMVGEVVN